MTGPMPTLDEMRADSQWGEDFISDLAKNSGRAIMEPQQLRLAMLANLAQLKALPLIFGRMTEQQRGIVNAQEKVLTAYDSAIIPYLRLVCAAYSSDNSNVGNSNVVGEVDGTFSSTLSEKGVRTLGSVGINWNELVDALSKLGEVGKTIAALIVMCLSD